MISLLDIAERTRKGGISELDIPALMKILSVKLDGQPVEPGRDIRECWDLARNRRNHGTWTLVALCSESSLPTLAWFLSEVLRCSVCLM